MLRSYEPMEAQDFSERYSHSIKKKEREGFS